MRSSAVLAIAAYVAIPGFVVATPMPADGSPPIIPDGAPFSRKDALNVSHSSIESNSNNQPHSRDDDGFPARVVDDIIIRAEPIVDAALDDIHGIVYLRQFFDSKSPRPSANSGGNSGSSQPQATTTEVRMPHYYGDKG
ncbi:hypothetical protein SCP_1403610 [Sparassis crispa]|uniref:Uncharacterized protein n=1 Tax=Sparassis crispa TaxID=139825 RepID=A0A401H3G8_9APHY|nr:hypothetical protein SCP_1403610 [Sparassis crispa]GBE88953.1 hypothetical protein SCP_1403610 [Sparassis crispa]